MKSLILKSAHILMALGALAVYAAPANAANVLMVREKVMLGGSVEEIWSKIGGYCQIADWHPAVKSCAVDGDVRTLTLQDGGTIIEPKTESEGTSYAYEIKESPMPIADYKARFSLKPKKDGKAMLIWSASFGHAKGKTDDDAKKAVEGVFKAGIKSLKEKFPVK